MNRAKKNKAKKNVGAEVVAFLFAFYCLCVLSCSKKIPEMTLEEIEQAQENVYLSVLSSTKSKPYEGQEYKTGVVGGDWYTSVTADPKTFNFLIAERDGASFFLLAMVTDSLSDYDINKRQWTAALAFPKIVENKEKQTMDVYFTIREEAFWSFYNSDKKIPVTSDDVIFWYDKIEGNPEFATSGYGSQFVTMPDGSSKRITIEKIDDKKFVFHYPRVVANPLLSTNTSVYPSFLYRKALEEGGVQAVKDIFSVEADVKTIPSCGMWFLVEYTPGQRLVYERNPDYWDKDAAGNSFPYRQRCIVQIVGDANTQLLLFKQGKQEAYSVSAREVAELASNQKDYTVYNADASLGAGFWSFNQNPKNRNEPYYKWFTKKEFRQAMSCILNRDRIIKQTYRSMASAKYDFFPKGNPFYNENIQLKYKYNPEMALSLLKKAGFTRRKNSDGTDGFLFDSSGNQVVFDLTIPSGVSTNSDIAQIIADECSKIGITLNVRQLDFQKIVELLTSTYDWHSVLMAFGANFWPTQGPNVWLSNGNLHLWYPLQKKPATDWEARIDYLYNEGAYTIDEKKAQKIWDEYQSIILEQCPVIYLVSARSFYAIHNKWNQTNFYYDNLNGAMTERIWLSQ